MEQYPFYDPNQYLPPEQNPYYKKEQRRSLSRIGFTLAGYVVFTALVQMAMILVCQWIAPQYVEHELFTLAMQTVPYYLLGLPLVACAFIGMPKKAPKKQKLTATGWVTFLAISFFLMMAGGYISTGLMAVVEHVMGNEITNAIDQQINQSSPWFNLVVMVLIAPAAEELIFRKLVIDRLLPYSEVLAVVTGGLLFGLVHGNFYQFFYAAFLGLLFSVVYVKTGKIRHTIAMHMIINFTGSIIADFIGKMSSDLASAPTSINPWDIVNMVYSLAMFALAVCGCILLFRNIKSIRLKKTGEHWLTLGTQFKLTWLNAGTITFCVICLLMFVFSLYI